MSWAIGERDGRHIGYGVPAICEHPDCSTEIDRGLSYACGGGVAGTIDNCGLFFCPEHLHYMDNDADRGEWVCERCYADLPPFDKKPDTAEWARHVLTDASWQQWRQENPERTQQFRDALRADQVTATCPTCGQPVPDDQHDTWLAPPGPHGGPWRPCCSRDCGREAAGRC